MSRERNDKCKSATSVETSRNDTTRGDTTPESQAASDASTKRTTVVLRADDLKNLDAVRRVRGGTSEMDAIRQSLKLTARLLRWADEGGEILLKRRGETIRIEFI